jgi:hypothetical protein
MYGDFSRDTFDEKKHFRRVLMQQGRVLLDADFNEQTAILLHNAEQVTRALAGRFAAVDKGFKVVSVEPDLSAATIEEGVYLVDGLICEHEARSSQLSIVRDDSNESLAPEQQHLLYLAAWERHVDPSEEDGLADPALGNAEAMGRTRIYWEVRAKSLKPEEAAKLRLPPVETGYNWLAKNLGFLIAGLVLLTLSVTILAYVTVLSRSERGNDAIFGVVACFILGGFGLSASAVWSMLRERPLSPGELHQKIAEYRGAIEVLLKGSESNPATLTVAHRPRTPPSSQKPLPGAEPAAGGGAPPRYQGHRNLLYRVEVHQGGNSDNATFKWSSDNGATTFPVIGEVQANGTMLELTVHDPHGRIAELHHEVWFELVAGGASHREQRLPLMRLAPMQKPSNGLASAAEGNVQLTLEAQRPFPPLALEGRYFLRAWDHAAKWAGSEDEGGVFKVSASGKHRLPDELMVTFNGGSYRPGDHWLFEVRRGQALPQALPGRRAVSFRYAPIALVNVMSINGKLQATIDRDLRLVLTPQMGLPAGRGA